MKGRKTEQFQFQQTPVLTVSPIGRQRKTWMLNPRIGKAKITFFIDLVLLLISSLHHEIKELASIPGF